MRKSIIKYYLILIIGLSLLSCQNGRDEDLINKCKTEILETEKAFVNLVKEKGIKVAFLMYASENAVLNRGNKLIKGKKAIEEYYENYKYPLARLEWEPDFIDVSDSGDLGYSYGQYKFEATDVSGKVIKDTGTFHTVWKRQSNGEWRYVWD
jgi:ketosteroid isomerase-like protein